MYVQENNVKILQVGYNIGGLININKTTTRDVKTFELLVLKAIFHKLNYTI